MRSTRPARPKKPATDGGAVTTPVAAGVGAGTHVAIEAGHVELSRTAALVAGVGLVVGGVLLGVVIGGDR